MNYKRIKTILSSFVTAGWFLMPLIMVKMPEQDKIDELIMTDLNIKNYVKASFLFTPQQIVFWLIILTTIFLCSWTVYDYYKKTKIGVAEICFFIFFLFTLSLTIYATTISY